MNGRTENETVINAAEILKRYCQETGCLYCVFCILDGQKIDCEIGHPRDWRNGQ